MLVLPFENTGHDPAPALARQASAVLVADGLNARGVAAISRDERVRAFEELHLPLSATLSRATLIKVAQLLGAVELVVGTFAGRGSRADRRGARIRVDAGRVRAPVTERGQLTDLFVSTIAWFAI